MYFKYIGSGSLVSTQHCVVFTIAVWTTLSFCQHPDSYLPMVTPVGLHSSNMALGNIDCEEFIQEMVSLSWSNENSAQQYIITKKDGLRRQVEDDHAEDRIKLFSWD